jgi:hypothetical protein
MWGHFRHLNFRTFPVVSWRPNLCLFAFSTKVLNIWNTQTSATPKVGVHLRVIGLHFVHSTPFVRVCFTPKHTFLTSWALYSTFSHKPNIKITIGLIIHPIFWFKCQPKIFLWSHIIKFSDPIWGYAKVSWYGPWWWESI